jgi:methylmalonyl-CoA mutase
MAERLPFDAFAPASRDDWLAAVASACKGAPFDELRTPLPDGFAIEPLSERARGMTPLLGRPAGRPWTVVQRVDHPDPAAANSLARAELEGGASGLALVTRAAPTARGFGVAIGGRDDLARALDGIALDLVAVRIEAGHLCADLALSLLDIAGGERREALDISVGLDPASLLAATGARPDVEALLGRLLPAPGLGSLMTADGRTFHDAGASPAQELGMALASGVAALRSLEKAGLALDAARRRLDFVLAADADLVLTLPKLRALRLLWARVEEACGLAPLPIRLHAESSWRMITRRDPWTNMLRATLAAFAAGTAGADSVTLLPFTSALGLPDGFARRVARNALHILLEEANIHRVADPAAGAGTFEAITDELCQRGWTIFQALERKGGILEAVSSGWVSAAIASVRQERPAPVIVGTNRFPAEEGETGHVLVPLPTGGDVGRGPLPPLRDAAPFEETTA